MTLEGSTRGDTPAGISRPAAIVFDMDGLLMDTERIALRGFLQACSAHGAQPVPGAFQRCIGTNNQRTRELLAEMHGPDFPLDAIIRTWDDYCHENMVRRPPPLKPGATEILTTARHHGIPCALATSTASREASDLIRVTGLDEFFVARVTGDQVENSKPHPEIYRLAVTLLGVDPRHAWALEDSSHGVHAASAAGLIVFQIPDLVPPDPSTLALGHRVWDSLHQVDNLLRRCVRDHERTAA